ncbi:MaoC family dehydratase [Haladaptatus sp. CMAA 1911]|uniref:MaoC family dehydratase n=1 Tax=unclassified Haladaptatus TaxID=2622732 RepID=UPI003754B953
MEAPSKDTDRYFEEIEEGETLAIENVRTITEADIVNFAGLSGDFHPLHMSSVTGEESDFGERIAHGNLVFSIAEALIADMNPKAFSYGYDELRFIKPTPIGTTLTVRREIVQTEEYNPSLGRVVYAYEVENRDNDTLLACKHITLCQRRDVEE